jgi:hypothetical protein
MGSELNLRRLSWTCARKGRSIPPVKRQEEITMGDKSPKAKDKSRKQDTAGKNQKAAAAKSKMAPPPIAGKKTK